MIPSLRAAARHQSSRGPLLGPRLVDAHWHQKTVDPGPRLVAFVSGVSPAIRQLEVGTDLPSKAPLSGVPRRSRIAQFTRAMSCVQLLVGVGRRAERRAATPKPPESTGRSDSVSRLRRGSS